MSKIYNKYEILVEQLNLPDVKPIRGLIIDYFDEKYDQNEFMDVFIEIFPDEIDSEKERELRSLKHSKTESTYIASYNGKIVGFLMTATVDFTEPIALIIYLGVLDKFRSKGIATLLLKKFKQDLISKGIPKIQAKIRSDNFQVLNYIKYLGFKQII